MRSMRFALKCLTLLLGAALAAALTALWLGHRAQAAAEAMKSSPWINNERCRAAVAALPSPPGGHFRFAVLGDIQIGTAQLPRILATLRKEEGPLSFAVQTGDFVSHPRPGQYLLSLSVLARSGLTMPLFVIPGNHDVRESAPVLGQAASPLFTKYFGAGQFSFCYGGALFVCADNSMGPLTREQYDWLENVLAGQSTPSQPVFLFLHAQPISWKGDGKVSLEPIYHRLFELTERYGVDYVFNGNWHGLHREERNGTVYLINGRGGDFDSDERLVPAYYTIVEVAGGRVTDRQVTLPPRMALVVESLVQDWLVAKLGYCAVAWPRTYLGVVALLAAGFLAGLGAIYADRRKKASPAMPSPAHTPSPQS